MYCLCSVITLIWMGHKTKKFFDTDTHASIDADICRYIQIYVDINTYI